jgi:hypothetical protein
MSELIKNVVSRKTDIAYENGYTPINYVPLRTNQYWEDYYNQIWRNCFLKKHTFAGITSYHAGDVWHFYNTVTWRELSRFPNELVITPPDTPYLKKNYPSMFANIKHWAPCRTINSLVNEQFKLLQGALTKSRRIVQEKKVKKVSVSKDGKTEEVEQVSFVDKKIYLEEFIKEFERHVQKNGELLGTFWDYREITNEVIDLAIEESKKRADDRISIPESKLTNEDLYKWANDKFNLGLVI